MKLFHKIHVYKLLLKASLKKAFYNALYSAIIVFLGSLAAQLQNTQQITTITVVAAILIAIVTFLTELRENYPLFKLLVEYKVAEKEFGRVLDVLKFARLVAEHEGND
jgi:uncharacterized membrane protein YfcA